MIDLVIPGDPVALGRTRARVVFYGRKCRTCGRGEHARAQLYTPKKSRDHERRVADLARAAGALPLTGPVEVEVLAGWEWPRSDWRVRCPRVEEYLDQCEDADNVAKAVLDGMNGIAFGDDRQVARLVVEKRRVAQGEGARTRVRVRSLARIC